MNFSQFRRVVPEAYVNGIWETAMLNPRAPSIRSLCPECQRDTAAVLVPLKDREVELEVCRTCQRVWLDRQERIAGHLRENAEPGPQPEARPISVAARMRMAGHMARRLRPALDPQGLRWGILILFLFFLSLRYCSRRF